MRVFFFFFFSETAGKERKQLYFSRFAGATGRLNGERYSDRVVVVVVVVGGGGVGRGTCFFFHDVLFAKATRGRRPFVRPSSLARAKFPDTLSRLWPSTS